MSKSYAFVIPKTILEGVRKIDKIDLRLSTDKSIEECYINILHDENLPKYIQLLNDNQMAALICFTMRKGIKATKTLCNKRTIDKVGDGILCYDKIESKINSKLAARRQAERDLYYEKPLFNIVSETSEKKPEVEAEAIVIKADTKSKNDRVYSKEVLENTVKESNTMKKSTSIQRRETIQKEDSTNTEEYINNYAAPMRRISMGRARSNEVKWLQIALNYCMDANLMVDGKFGPETEIAVIKFKVKNGLIDNNIVTGVVDPVTRDLIIEKCNKK